MPHNSSNNPATKTPPAHGTQPGKTSPGCRVVHVAVPEAVFNHAKAQAYLSGLRWPDFIKRLLSEAKPFEDRQTASST